MPDNKEQLTDIIISKDSSGFGGFKKVILAVAFFAAILIVVVVIMGSLNSDKNRLTNNILPPEPTTKSKDKNELFKNVDIKEESVDDEQKRLEKIAKEIKSKIPSKTAVPKFEDEIVTIDELKNEKKEPVKPKKIKVKEVKTKKIVEKKKVVKTAKVVKTIPTTKNTKGSWYIQVGAFAQGKPSPALINKIKKLGYQYKVYNTRVHNKSITKLLIGPYQYYKQAKKVTEKVKKTIEEKAYPYQVVK